MQIERFNQPTQNSDTFYQPGVTNAQYTIGTEKQPDVGKNCDDERDKFSQAYREIVS